MAGTSTASRVITVVVGVLVVVSVGGLITVGVLSFVRDRYNGYGEIPIPGTADVVLPAGRVTVNFHTRTGGRGTAVPPLQMSITPPPGGSDPEVTDELGGSVTVNDDVHRRVWVMRVAEAGRYRVSIDGPVGGFQDPRLAFGNDSSMEGLLWVFVAMSILSVDLAVAVIWMRRRQAADRRAAPSPPSAPAGPYTPTDQGVRLEQLKTIAALRQSGALTEDEFRAEKRRILDGR